MNFDKKMCFYRLVSRFFEPPLSLIVYSTFKAERFETVEAERAKEIKNIAAPIGYILVKLCLFNFISH